MMELGNMAFGHSRGEFEVPRGDGYEEEIERLFAVICEPRKRNGYATPFENETFVIRSYWWGDCLCHDDSEEPLPTCQAHWPNFAHKPSGYELRWYKYPLRDSYANKKLTLAEFAALIDSCIASMVRT